MSSPHLTTPSLSLKTQAQTHRTVVISALLALAATVSIVLVLALTDDSFQTASLAGKAEPARAHSGPNESAVASAVATPTQTSAGPSESSIAASVAGSAFRPIGGPDESSVAASVSGSTVRSTSGPDESSIAASVSEAQPAGGRLP